MEQATVIAVIVSVWVMVMVDGLPITEDLGNEWEKSGQFEGDIVLQPSQMNRNGMRNTQKYWPSGIMYYTISSTFTSAEQAVIQRAIYTYNSQTCVKLQARTTQNNYVAINKTNSGCSSAVGMVGGGQRLSLGPGCVHYGTVLHELLHALGFWHMQSTYNRDNYVTIVYGNIQPGKEHNFKKYSSEEINDFGLTYDYGSIMHYSKNAFSANGQPTIVPKKANAVIGQSNGLSLSDIRKLNRMYRCSTG